MAIFRYIASGKDGQELRGAMDAPNAQEVQLRLSERGYRQVQVLSAAAETNAMANGAVRRTPTAAYTAPPQTVRGLVFGIPKPEDAALFFRQMASLVHAGFGVSAALSDLAPRTAHRGLANAARAMGAATANGANLAGQMVQYPNLFPSHVVGLVAAGETGGFVEFAFEEAALNAEQDAALRQGLWVAKILLWNVVWTVLLLQPLFPSIDTKRLSNSASPTEVFRSFAGYGHALAWAIPLGIGLHIGAHLIGKMRHQPFARDFFDALSVRIPVMARLAKMRAMASFTRVLRRLLMSGISTDPAFTGAVAAVPNATLREQLSRGIPLVRAGQGIDQAIEATGLMGHDPLQMLVTGQKTGQWLEMLDRVTAFYQDEAARATQDAKSFQKRLGVILTIVVTGYVLCVSTYGCYQIVFKVTDEMTK